jgi:hypothetical protein
MVGFWYMGLGEAIGVMEACMAALNTCMGIGGCEQEDVGLE